jgi:hypothetical protein
MMKRLLCLLLAATSVASAQDLPALDAKKFHAFDNNERLASQLYADSLTKWLVNGSNPQDPQQLVGVHALDGVIIEMIGDGKAAELVAADLIKGDDQLRLWMQRMLSSYNYAENQANSLLTKWATTGSDETLVTVLNNAAEREETLVSLRSYLTTTSADWVKAVYASNSIIAGTSKIPLDQLRQSLINTGGVEVRGVDALLTAAKDGTPKDRWAVASTLGRIMDGNGSLARSIRATELPEGSFYATAWSRLGSKIAGDPLLLREYAARTRVASEIYQTVRTIMVRALATDGQTFGEGLIEASQIPGSRFEWLVDQALFDRGGVRSVAGGAARMSATTHKVVSFAISNTCAQNIQWSDFLLWELTRPAEALVMTTRASLPSVLGTDEELAARFARQPLPFGADFESLLATTDAYTFYAGGAAEFRTRIGNKDVERRALLQFGAAIGNLLARSDEAWAAALTHVSTRGETEHTANFTLLIAATIEKDNTVANAWVKTLVTNDANLYMTFAAWMRAEGHQSDPDAMKRWLDSVSGAFRSGNLVGNVDISTFKTWLGQFVQNQNGWMATRLRFDVESVTIPYRLREIMVREALSRPEVFWKLYAVICKTSGFAVSTIKPKMVDYANQTGIAKAMLDEIMGQNQLASDAVYPMYDTLLASGSPVLDNLEKVVTDGVSLSNGFGLALLSMRNVGADDASWVLMKHYAASHYNFADENSPALRDKFVEDVNANSAQLIPLLKLFFGDKKITEEWRLDISRQVRFCGKAYIVATLIRRDFALSRLWAETLAKTITEDPSVVKSMVDSLGARRVGDARWNNNIRMMKVRLAELVFGDRVFFEQLTSDHNQSYRQDLKTTATSIFGAYNGKQWVP